MGQANQRPKDAFAWRVASVVVVAIVLFVAGAVSQRFYGLGNAFRALNPSYVPLSKRPVLSPDHVGRLDIFVLAGQSNMQGAGKLSEYKPLDTFGRIYVFETDFRWRIAEEPLSGDAVGPGLSFAHEMAKKGRIVGLVPCARGGTSIMQWQRNLDEKSIYGSCLMKTKAASVAGKVAGLLFLQGENDAGKPKALLWGRHFTKYVDDFRTDLSSPGLPVVFAQIGAGQSKGWADVKTSQKTVLLPNTRIIKTDDLPYYADSIHFTTESQMEIGRRFAAALDYAQPPTEP